MTSHRLALTAIAASLAAVTLAGPGQAQSLTTQVAYGDLDLTSAGGVTSLHRRVNSAVNLVCGQADAANRIAVARCRAETRARTQANVDLALAKAGRDDTRLAAR